MTKMHNTLMISAVGMFLHLLFIQDNVETGFIQFWLAFFAFIGGAVMKAFYDDAQIGDNSMKLAVLFWALASFKVIGAVIVGALIIAALWWRGHVVF